MKANKKTLFKAQKNRVSKNLMIFLVLLSILLGNETQVVAQLQVDFSNPRITTDCCPEFKQKLDSMINNAPFVFEGQMIKRFMGGNYVAYLFEIEKVYRGGKRLQAGTVEVIVKNPQWISNVSDYSVQFAEATYIVFAKEIESVGAFDANNSIKLELLDDKGYKASCFGGRSAFPMGVMPIEDSAHLRVSFYRGFELNFKTKQEVLDFMGTFGLSSANVSKADTLKILSRREIEELEQGKTRIIYERIAPQKTKEEADSIIRDVYRKRGLDYDSIQNRNNNINKNVIQQRKDISKVMKHSDKSAIL